MNHTISFKQSADLVLELGERLLEIKKTEGYSDEDARGAALSNCQYAALSAVMTLNILSMGEEGRISGDDFKKLIGMKTGDLQLAADIWEKVTRLGFLVVYQFQVENMLRNIIRELGLPELGQGFYQVARAITDLLPESGRKLELLYLPAMIRNSLHANGIHHGYRGSSTSIVLDGVSFDFTHMEKVSCAGWGHLSIALNAAADIVEEILQTPAVQALEDPILDQYTWEQATEPNEVA